MKSSWKYSVIKVTRLKILSILALLGLTFLAIHFFAPKQADNSIQTNTEESIAVPVVMYHSLLKDPSRHGEYVISPDTLEKDLTYLKENGYETVVVQDLINYTNGGNLPAKPVMITFDDGYYNNYLYGMEIAEKLDCKFVVSPIVSVTELFTASQEENAYYSHLTWDMLKEMSDSGRIEVQNHSYDMHTIGARKGVKKKQGESDESYKKAIENDLLKAQDEIEKHVGKRPTAFAYPFGAVSKTTPELIKEMGFSATLTSAEKISVITRDKDSLYNLGRFVRPSGITTKEFFEKKMKLAIE
ncbi:polysaccharide deacetylase family protein [Scatolibacter rhodanostii]|uniref:polysaccharide deacetylase family protein n=1 Tax=Scatolibacter rhodanostii TaxID=2014781 RepID=UPI000C08276B|nr:polysaccharide deacetylase family protein [Scatolibacter rhodanostii]